MTREQYQSALRGSEINLEAFFDVVDNEQQKIRAKFVNLRFNNRAEVVLEVLLQIENKLLPDGSSGKIIEKVDLLIGSTIHDVPVFNLVGGTLEPVLDDEGNPIVITESDMWAYYWEHPLPMTFKNMIHGAIVRKYHPTADPLVFINPL